MVGGSIGETGIGIQIIKNWIINECITNNI